MRDSKTIPPIRKPENHDGRVRKHEPPSNTIWLGSGRTANGNCDVFPGLGSARD
jgi:hypothetical protein